MRRFRNSCTVYCLLPEAEFDCTRLEVDEFLTTRLCQTVSQKGSKTLMEKLAERVSLSQGRIWQLMESPEMSDPEVACRVSAAISATQPYLSTTLGGSFEGLMGQLGLNLTDASDPPLSQREGYITQFAEAISGLFKDKGVALDVDWVNQVVRNWNHKDEFRKRLASKTPAGIGSPLLPELLPFLEHLHKQEMENLEQDLDFGEPEGAEIWELFKEDEVPHPRNLLEQMWRLVQQTIRDPANQPPEGDDDDPELPDNPDNTWEMQTHRRSSLKMMIHQMDPGHQALPQICRRLMRSSTRGRQLNHCWKMRQTKWSASNSDLSPQSNNWPWFLQESQSLSPTLLFLSPKYRYQKLGHFPQEAHGYFPGFPRPLGPMRPMREVGRRRG